MFLPHRAVGAQGGQRREKTVLATKLYGDMDPWPNNGKLSALNIRRALDASLKRLQTDYIDLRNFKLIASRSGDTGATGRTPPPRRSHVGTNGTGLPAIRAR